MNIPLSLAPLTLAMVPYVAELVQVDFKLTEDFLFANLLAFSLSITSFLSNASFVSKKLLTAPRLFKFLRRERQVTKHRQEILGILYGLQKDFNNPGLQAQFRDILTQYSPEQADRVPSIELLTQLLSIEGILSASPPITSHPIFKFILSLPALPVALLTDMFAVTIVTRLFRSIIQGEAVGLNPSFYDLFAIIPTLLGIISSSLEYGEAVSDMFSNFKSCCCCGRSSLTGKVPVVQALMLKILPILISAAITFPKVMVSIAAVNYFGITPYLNYGIIPYGIYEFITNWCHYSSSLFNAFINYKDTRIDNFLPGGFFTKVIINLLISPFALLFGFCYGFFLVENDVRELDMTTFEFMLTFGGVCCGLLIPAIGIALVVILGLYEILQPEILEVIYLICVSAFFWMPPLGFIVGCSGGLRRKIYKKLCVLDRQDLPRLKQFLEKANAERFLSNLIQTIRLLDDRGIQFIYNLWKHPQGDAESRTAPAEVSRIRKNLALLQANINSYHPWGIFGKIVDSTPMSYMTFLGCLVAVGLNIRGLFSFWFVAQPQDDTTTSVPFSIASLTGSKTPFSLSQIGKPLQFITSFGKLLAKAGNILPIISTSADLIELGVKRDSWQELGVNLATRAVLNGLMIYGTSQLLHTLPEEAYIVLGALLLIQGYSFYYNTSNIARHVRNLYGYLFSSDEVQSDRIRVASFYMKKQLLQNKRGVVGY